VRRGLRARASQGKHGCMGRGPSFSALLSQDPRHQAWVCNIRPHGPCSLGWLCWVHPLIIPFWHFCHFGESLGTPCSSAISASHRKSFLSSIFRKFARCLGYKLPSESHLAYGNPPCAPMLTALRLANIREGLLGRILSTTPNLQKLYWHWLYREDRGCRPGDGIVRDIIDCDQIVDDLHHIKHSLSELVMTAEQVTVDADLAISYVLEADEAIQIRL
jgi:hypothetical protein